MSHIIKLFSLRYILILVLSTTTTHSVLAQETVETNYEKHCSACHGQRLEGKIAGALNTGQWKYAKDEKHLFRIIKQGIPEKNKSGFSQQLSDKEVRALVVFLYERIYDNQLAQLNTALKPKDGVHTAAKHAFTLRKVAGFPGALWSMDFLPDGSIITTQKNGELWLLEPNGKKHQIKKVPSVSDGGQGGLLEVAAHPDYKKNGWVYLTFSDSHLFQKMTKVVRGKIIDNEWSNEETIYKADYEHYSVMGHHFGSRIVFDDGYIYFSVGDRGQRQLAQSLKVPYGKIHRLHDDGRIPKDNPYVGTADALDSIWSHGHRNPQGLALDPKTKILWESEHGPRGGDEINVIQPGKNYGWPIVSYGIEYSGKPFTALTELPNMKNPQHYWIPSIAVSDIDFYTGDKFPAWTGKLLVSSLAKQQLHLLTIEGQNVVSDTILLKGQGRIRDVADGPDGFPYIIINKSQGEIYKLEKSP